MSDYPRTRIWDEDFNLISDSDVDEARTLSALGELQKAGLLGTRFRRHKNAKKGDK